MQSKKKESTQDAKAVPISSEKEEKDSTMNNSKEELQKVVDFCRIQLQILDIREDRLRKEIFDCKVQKEFLTETLAVVSTQNKQQE